MLVYKFNNSLVRNKGIRFVYDNKGKKVGT